MPARPAAAQRLSRQASAAERWFSDRVKRVTRYRSFEEMLDGEGPEKVNPDSPRDQQLASIRRIWPLPQRRYPGTASRVERWIMSLNIKNAETHQLVQELATLTGETQTAAVTIAVRERLDRVRHLHEAGLADRLLAIGQDTAPRLQDPFRSADHGDLLYDERGLPA